MNSSAHKTVAVILAAGKGVRMKSAMPKVLHPILGKPMVSYVMEACRKAKTDRNLLVVGYGAEQVKRILGDRCEYVLQAKQLGTGHALMTAADSLKGFHGNILVLVGDAPFLTGSVLKKLIQKHSESNAAATLMTAVVDPPPPYGRIVRNSAGNVLRIVEERDAASEEKKITEVNTSHYCFKAGKVLPLLSRLGSDNDQGEYYLTDVIGLMANDGERIETVTVADPMVLMGINSRSDLDRANTYLKKKIADHWMKNGVTLVDSDSIYIEPDVRIGRDTIIHPFTSLQGKTKIHPNCIIGPQVLLRDACIQEGCRIQFSVIENRSIEKETTIGPFAYMTGDPMDV
jgi:bifunctional UDP-N-acetylglucosamine pyrophosphorylase/glucosamine-1-phosphate N-acetyltransferase